jgi:A/G-specific adenine glycosylase
VMLQQTQVNRVIPKYSAFIAQFPDLEILATASLGDVLRLWSGLGYNRRAKFLHQAAKQITDAYDGKIPKTITELTTLPGIGKNTAGAILAYAFNQPAVFIETNIRTAYLHHFFNGQASVADQSIVELVQRTLPKRDARNWYWSLMDYGSYLKRAVGNPNVASKAYAKQSNFKGSKRQVRGQVIRLLSARPQTRAELQSATNDERLASVLQDLEREGLISKTGQSFSL